jgi:RNA polymerase sigma-70 factor (ECF subfamily)
MASTLEAALDDVCVRIFEADFDYVYRSLLRMGVSASDAEDLAQEVFLVMWRRRADWDAGRPLRPWLFGVALRIAHEHRSRRGRESPVGFVDQTDERPRGEEHLAAARARALVLRAIASLPEKQRAVLILHEIEGTPMRDVATVLTVPLFTAYTRLRAARKSFAKAVRRLELARPGALDERLEPTALLDDERTRAVPVEAKRRAVARARAIAAAPPPLPTPPPVSGGGWGWRAPALAAGVVAAVAITGIVNHRLSTAHATRQRLAAAAHAPRSGPSVPTFTPAVAEPALGHGLVGYWRFEDAAGGLVRDLSPNHVDCRPHRIDLGRAAVDGVAGRAFHFDGLAHFECGAPTTMSHLDKSMTVAGWIKLDRAEFDLRAVLAWQRGSGKSRFALFFGVAGAKAVLASDVWGRVEAPLGEAVGRWRHLAASYDHGQMRLYLDGVEAAHENAEPASLGSGLNPLTIGGHLHEGVPPAKVAQRFHGVIDEVVLYDRALLPTEIALLASHEAPAAMAAATTAPARLGSASR